MLYRRVKIFNDLFYFESIKQKTLNDDIKIEHLGILKKSFFKIFIFSATLKPFHHIVYVQVNQKQRQQCNVLFFLLIILLQK